MYYTDEVAHTCYQGTNDLYLSYVEFLDAANMTYKQEIINILYNYPYIYQDFEIVFLFLMDSVYSTELTWVEAGERMGDILYQILNSPTV